MGLRGASSKTMASSAPPTNLTLTGSPFTYQNLSGGPQDAMISGGTVSLIEYSRDGTIYYVVGLLSGIVALNPNDRLRVTYLTAPTITIVQIS